MKSSRSIGDAATQFGLEVLVDEVMAGGARWTAERLAAAEPPPQVAPPA
ncbi:hypothetical protein [Microbacterium sp. BK668]|nr:hypothetical protein [Microbacterium sp. BK668]